MPAEQLLAQRRQAIVRGLDDQQLLPVLGDAAFPPIDRAHAVDDVHARGEPQVDERMRESAGIEVRAHGREHDDELHSGRSASTTISAASRAAAFVSERYCDCCTNGIATTAKIREPPRYSDVGITAVFRFESVSDASSFPVGPSYTRTSAATRDTTTSTETPISCEPMPMPPSDPSSVLAPRIST